MWLAERWINSDVSALKKEIKHLSNKLTEKDLTKNDKDNIHYLIDTFKDLIALKEG